jgi:hypothetical protein
MEFEKRLSESQYEVATEALKWSDGILYGRIIYRLKLGREAGSGLRWQCKLRHCMTWKKL